MDAVEELTGNVSRYPHAAMGRVGIAEFLSGKRLGKGR
jgi:hypothetical protein